MAPDGGYVGTYLGSRRQPSQAPVSSEHVKSQTFQAQFCSSTTPVAGPASWPSTVSRVIWRIKAFRRHVSVSHGSLVRADGPLVSQFSIPTPPSPIEPTLENTRPIIYSLDKMDLSFGNSSAVKTKTEPKPGRRDTVSILTS